MSEDKQALNNEETTYTLEEILLEFSSYRQPLFPGEKPPGWELFPDEPEEIIKEAADPEESPEGGENAPWINDADIFWNKNDENEETAPSAEAEAPDIEDNTEGTPWWENIDKDLWSKLEAAVPFVKGKETSFVDDKEQISPSVCDTETPAEEDEKDLKEAADEPSFAAEQEEDPFNIGIHESYIAEAKEKDLTEEVIEQSSILKGELTPLAEDEEESPTADGEDTPQTEDGEETPAPDGGDTSQAEDEEETPAADGEDTPQAEDGEESPAADGEDTPRADGEETPAADGEDTPQAEDGEESPAADGEDTPQAEDGEESPAADEEDTPQAEDGEESPAADGEDTPQAEDGEEIPAADGEDTPQAEDGEESPAADGEEIPSAEGEDTAKTRRHKGNVIPFPAGNPFQSGSAAGAFWAALLRLRPQLSRKERQPRSEPILPPDEPPRELAAKYGEGLSGLRLRCIGILLLAVPLLYLAITEAFSLPLPPFLNAIYLRGWISAGLLVVSMLLSREVLKSGLVSLFKGKPRLETLSTLACLAVLADTVTLLLCSLRPESLPFCAPAALVLAFHELGIYWKRYCLRLTCRTACSASEPYLVTLDPVGEKSKVFRKHTGVPDGFGSQIMGQDGAEERFQVWTPVLLITAVVLSLLSTLAHHQPGLVFWALSASLLAASTLSGCLCFSLPYLSLARRLSKSGAALAGWPGIKIAGSKRSILLSDSDLFPPGFVTLRGAKMFQNHTPIQVLSITATMIRESGSGLTPLFHYLMQAEDAVYCSLSDFTRYENGLSATIQGHLVYVGNQEFMIKMGIIVPARIQVRSGVFCAINRELAGLYALQYSIPNAVGPAVYSLIDNRISPVLAFRDFNVSIPILRRRLKLPKKGLAVLGAELQDLLLDPDSPYGERLVAVLCREGIEPYAAAITGARRLAQTVITNTRFAGLGSAVGILLVFLLSSAGALTALSAASMSVFLFMWLIPILLISGGVNQF